jgi:hypothetical protein
MKTLIQVSILFFLAGSILLAQEEGSFNVEIERDTILLGNTFELTYVIENVKGDFVPPDFSGLRVVSGPNTSSQFSMINGKTTRSASYSYILMPQKEGEYIIPPAELESGDEIFTSHEVPIFVLPNPEGKIQSSEESKYFRQEKQPEQSKKRKSYKL